jgi:hypothetical protein
MSGNERHFGWRLSVGAAQGPAPVAVLFSFRVDDRLQLSFSESRRAKLFSVARAEFAGAL